MLQHCSFVQQHCALCCGCSTVGAGSSIASHTAAAMPLCCMPCHSIVHWLHFSLCCGFGNFVLHHQDQFFIVMQHSWQLHCASHHGIFLCDTALQLHCKYYNSIFLCDIVALQVVSWHFSSCHGIVDCIASHAMAFLVLWFCVSCHGVVFCAKCCHLLLLVIGTVFCSTSKKLKKSFVYSHCCKVQWQFCFVAVLA